MDGPKVKLTSDGIEVTDTEEEFRLKVVKELHDIALSLRAISGRDKVTKIDDSNRSYADKYFAKSIPDNSR